MRPVGGAAVRVGVGRSSWRPFVLGLAVAAGCRPSRPALAPSVAASPVVREYLAARKSMAAAACDWHVRCGIIAAGQRAECEKGPPPDGEMTLVWGDPRLDWTIAALANGHLSFDGARAAVCIEALRASSCRQPRIPWGKCGLTSPALPPGAKCSNWGECAGSDCSAQLGCQGRCVARLAKGAPCTTSGNEGLCDEGESCNIETMRCRPKLAVGATCEEWDSCADGLSCVGAMKLRDHPHAPEYKVPGHCRGPGRNGESCQPFWNECADGFVCDAYRSSCVPTPATGGPCTSPGTCPDGESCVGLHDRGAARCAPFLDAGAACDPDALETGCPRSLRCDRKSRTCRSQGHRGDPCKPNGGCNAALYCDWKTLTCQPSLPEGAPCLPPPPGLQTDEMCFIGRCDFATRVCHKPCGD